MCRHKRYAVPLKARRWLKRRRNGERSGVPSGHCHAVVLPGLATLLADAVLRARVGSGGALFGYVQERDDLALSSPLFLLQRLFVVGSAEQVNRIEHKGPSISTTEYAIAVDCTSIRRVSVLKAV